jgi:hypothetical protein
MTQFQDVINEAVKAIVVTSIGAIAPLVVAIVVKIFQKFHIELSEVQEVKIRGAVQNILLEVEEWASHRLKANFEVTSGQKLERAVEAIVTKFPGIDDEEATKLVREELPKIGLGAVSFLAEAAKAATQNPSK